MYGLFPLSHFCSPEGYVLSGRFAQAQLDCLEFEKLKNGAYAQKTIVATKQGIQLGDDHFVMEIRMAGWKKFTSDKPVDWRVSGLDACHIFREYQEWAVEHDVAAALKKLQIGATTFEDIRTENPRLLKHPAIQQALAQAFAQNAMPKRPRGQPKGAKPTREELELYFYVCIKRLRGVSLEKACNSALNEQPELIPKSWDYGAQPENLKRTVKRLDKERWFFTEWDK